MVKTLQAGANPHDRDIEFHLFAHRILSAWDAMRIPNSALDATLLGLIHADGKLIVIFWGDGVLHIQHKNGEVSTLVVDYDRNHNAPYYPAYDMLPDRRNAEYRTQFGDPRPTRDWRSKTLRRPIELENTHPIFELPIDTIESVSIFSDGAQSFLKDLEHVKTFEVIDRCTDFKSIEGELVKRRINKCRKLWSKENVQHTDDFSMATIFFPSEPQPEFEFENKEKSTEES